MGAEPTLGQVRDELVTRLDLDTRVRGVEIKQASMETALTAVQYEVRSTKTELLAAIEANAPKPVWPAVSALCAVMVVLMGFFAAIYGGK